MISFQVKPVADQFRFIFGFFEMSELIGLVIISVVFTPDQVVVLHLFYGVHYKTEFIIGHRWMERQPDPAGLVRKIAEINLLRDFIRLIVAHIEQKVANQQSAAVSVAKARKTDRSLNTDGAMDETDRETARTLRDGKKKKRKKAASAGGLPAWAKFLPPVLGLLAIAAVAWYLFLKPEGQEKLFAEVTAATTPDAKIEKAEPAK